MNKTKAKSKPTVRSVVRRLNMDEVEGEKQQQTGDGDVLLVDADGKVTTGKKTNTEQHHDNNTEEGHEIDRDRRRSKHRRSRSHGHVP